MAKNRLNLAGYRSLTGALGRKLGILYKNGGHIFESILDPERTTESGETFGTYIVNGTVFRKRGSEKKKKRYAPSFASRNRIFSIFFQKSSLLILRENGVRRTSSQSGDSTPGGTAAHAKTVGTSETTPINFCICFLI